MVHFSAGAGAGRREAPDPDLLPGDRQLDPARNPHRPFDAPEPRALTRVTTKRLYERWREAWRVEKATLGRVVGQRAHNAEPPDLAALPENLRLVQDLRGRLWTDVYGAAMLAGISRRLVYVWKQKGWLKVRYTASGKLEVRVDSLWWPIEDRNAALRAAKRAAKLAAQPTHPGNDELIGLAE